MSSSERNLGKLTPIGNSEEYCKSIGVTELPASYGNFREYIIEELWDNDGILVINDTVYSVEWKVKREKDVHYFADVEENEDGTINFHTLHWDGGSSLSEVIESGLKQNREG